MADAFVPAFASLLPPDTYAIRVAESDPSALPAAVGAALHQWPALFHRLEAVRPALIYDGGWRHEVEERGPAGQQMGRALAPPLASCSAAHAILAELQARFAHRASQGRSRTDCLGGGDLWSGCEQR